MMKKHLGGIAVATLALLLLGAGCGSSPSAEQPRPEAKAPEPLEMTQPAPTAETVPSATATAVSIENFKFSPSSITVKKGTTITWTQMDSTPHTVTVEKGDGPDSPLLQKGETYSYKFDNVGTYAYHCKPHPYMKGTIVVEAE